MICTGIFVHGFVTYLFPYSRTSHVLIKKSIDKPLTSPPPTSTSSFPRLFLPQTHPLPSTDTTGKRNNIFRSLERLTTKSWWFTVCLHFAAGQWRNWINVARAATNPQKISFYMRRVGVWVVGGSFEIRKNSPGFRISLCLLMHKALISITRIHSMILSFG